MSGKILFVMTGADQWTLNDGTTHPTGFWAEEAVTPYEIFTESGYQIVVATPGGVRPPVDEGSLAPAAAGSAEIADHQRAVIATAPEFAHPIDLADADPADYDAVFVPGGHGPMEDLSDNPDARRLLRAVLSADQLLAIVCHGPAILLSAHDELGVNDFAGYTVTAFSNAEEEQAGLAAKAPWLLQDRLVGADITVHVGPAWVPHIESDRHLLTGQNPASSAPLAEELLSRLGAQG